MGMKLYVGNLSYENTNATLEELFAPFGTVQSAQVIMDRDTGRSKGFGFVEMSDANAARAAIQSPPRRRAAAASRITTIIRSNRPRWEVGRRSPYSLGAPPTSLKLTPVCSLVTRTP